MGLYINTIQKGDIMKRIKLLTIIALFTTTNLQSQQTNIDNYNVEWKSPSENSAGSMPLGNGELGANLWVEKNGDLLFYLSRTDAISEANRLMKIGRIRVSFTPNPFLEGNPFSQQLILKDGAIHIVAGKTQETVKMCFYMDPNQATAYLKMESNSDIKVQVKAEFWRNATHEITNEESLSAWLLGKPSWVHVTESADKFLGEGKEIIWYHQNESSIYDLVMKHQQKESVSQHFPDPIRHRIWGACLSSPNLKKINDSILVSPKGIRSCELKITTHSAQLPTLQTWKQELKDLAKKSTSNKAFIASQQWWSKFWEQSYIYIDIPGESKFAHQLTQSYILQRYMLAGSGRGNFPIKYNGSIFTTDPQYTDTSKKLSPDYRNWGNDFWWQNTRLPYYAMLACGDFEQMRALFNFYLDRLPAFQMLAKKYYQAKGAFIPETVTIFGTYANGDYGWNRTGHSPNEVLSMYIRHIWVQSLELSKIMLDYASFSGDTSFLTEKALPAIKEFILYFDSRFRNEQGEIHITPTQAVETYWYQVENDMPTVAGLHYVLNALENLPAKLLSQADRDYYKELKKHLPPLPQKTIAQGNIFLPAEVFLEKRSNVENPELYAVFPFGLANFANSLHQTGILTFRNRNFDSWYGWGQDGQEAAILGLVDETTEMLRKKINNTNPNHRFLAMWGPNYDWVPDQDHGSNIMLTLQYMILQNHENKAYLLPCWPKNWNLQFKLHTSQSTIIKGCYRDGKLTYQNEGDIKDIISIPDLH